MLADEWNLNPVRMVTIRELQLVEVVDRAVL